MSALLEFDQTRIRHEETRYGTQESTSFNLSYVLSYIERQKRQRRRPQVIIPQLSLPPPDLPHPATTAHIELDNMVDIHLTQASG